MVCWFGDVRLASDGVFPFNDSLGVAKNCHLLGPEIAPGSFDTASSFVRSYPDPQKKAGQRFTHPDRPVKKF